MNSIAKYLPNGGGQSQGLRVSRNSSGDSSNIDYDPRFADMPPLEDLNVRYNSTCDKSGSETALFDKYDSLPKVVVSHFPFGVSEAQLLAIFEEFNPIMCRIMVNAPMPVVVISSSACIYFKDEKDAVAAQKLDRTLYKNYIIEVKHVPSIVF